MTKIIFLNGPAGSGKDTIGFHLAESLYHDGYKVKMEKFAKPLKEMAARIFNWEVDGEEYRYYFETSEGKAEIIPGSTDPDWEENPGITYRRLLIDISEELLKPRFGKEVFGTLCRKRLEEIWITPGLDVAIITDCGFIEEIHPVVQSFNPENCFVFRLSREGCAFKGDSRGYLTKEAFDDSRLEDYFSNYSSETTDTISFFDLDNNRGIIEVVDEIRGKSGLLENA